MTQSILSANEETEQDQNDVEEDIEEDVDEDSPTEDDSPEVQTKGESVEEQDADELFLP